MLPHSQKRQPRSSLPERRSVSEPLLAWGYGDAVAAFGIWSILTRDGTRERRRYFAWAGGYRKRTVAPRRLTCAWRFPVRWLTPTTNAVCAWPRWSSGASFVKLASNTYPRRRLANMCWSML